MGGKKSRGGECKVGCPTYIRRKWGKAHAIKRMKEKIGQIHIYKVGSGVPAKLPAWGMAPVRRFGLGLDCMWLAEGAMGSWKRVSKGST